MTNEEFNAYEKSEYIRMKNKYEEMHNTYHRWCEENWIAVAVGFFLSILITTAIVAPIAFHLGAQKYKNESNDKTNAATETAIETNAIPKSRFSLQSRLTLSLWSPSRSSMSFFQSSMSCSCSSILRCSTAIRSLWRFCVLPSFGMPQSFIPHLSSISHASL